MTARRAYLIGLDLADDVRVVRALDVAAIGPVMIAASLWGGPLPVILRLLIGLFGVTTIAYNWRGLRGAELRSAAARDTV